MKGIVLAVALLSSSALAQTTLIVPAYTHHVFHDSKENDRNWGAGIEYQFRPSLSVLAEDYQNSDYRNALVVGAAYEPLHLRCMRMGGAVGLDLTHGYTQNPYWPLIGDARAVLRLSRHWGLGLDVIPSTNIGMSMSVRYVLRGGMK